MGGQEGKKGEMEGGKESKQYGRAWSKNQISVSPPPSPPP